MQKSSNKHLTIFLALKYQTDIKLNNPVSIKNTV